MDAGRLHRLARVLRALATTASADPDEPGVTPGLLAVVEDVADHDGTSIGLIAQRTGLAQSLVSRTVTAMRDAGILTTAPDPADGRKSLVGVNPDARAGILRARGSRPIDDAVAGLRPEASPEQRRRVSEILDELAELLLD